MYASSHTHFREYIDLLQSVMSMYSEMGHIVFMNDFNAHLQGQTYIKPTGARGICFQNMVSYHNLVAVHSHFVQVLLLVLCLMGIFTNHLKIITYEDCSNMNTSSFITFFTYMLRQNVIPFWKELFVVFKMAPNIKKHSLYFSSYS